MYHEKFRFIQNNFFIFFKKLFSFAHHFLVMYKFERVILQEKAKLVKSSFLFSETDIYLTEEQLYVEMNNYYLRPLKFLNSNFKLRFLSLKRKKSIFFNNIKRFNTFNSASKGKIISFELEDFNGKRYIFELKNNSELIKTLKDKLNIYN